MTARNPNNGLASEDYFETTRSPRATCRNGISHSTTINGGFGEDDFTVYRNLAELSCSVTKTTTRFTVRAFVKVNPDDPDAPFTNINGGQGADFIAFTVNAPVRIDGGDGFDTLTVIGTEFGDDFVVTCRRRLSAPVSSSPSVHREAHHRCPRGQRHFWIASTSDKVAVESSVAWVVTSSKSAVAMARKSPLSATALADTAAWSSTRCPAPTRTT